MGLMQLFRYPSQNAILKTVSEGLKSGKKDPRRKHTDSYMLLASRQPKNLGKESKHFFFFLLFRAHLEVPRLGAESELQLPAYTTATATPDPSRICDLHYSSGQRRILYPLSEGLNLSPHGYQLDLFPFLHSGNSSKHLFIPLNSFQ